MSTSGQPWRLPWIVCLMILLAGCTGGDAARPEGFPTPGASERGGTLRLAVPDSDLYQIGGLDPQKEYGNGAWELFRCCLLRTLYSYNGKPTDQGGAELRPDLAEGLPEVSPDGLTWTFRLRTGIRYGPPFQETEVTSADLVRALQREASVADPTRSYPFYYSVIQGFDAYAAGKADSISGLETPDERTLVVRLTEPVSDLDYRFSLAGTSPIPPGAADGHDEHYGRFLAASGPYMIGGSEALDPTGPPGDQPPVSGFVPATVKAGRVVKEGSVTMVRNPSWDPATDRLREALPDRIEIALGGEEQRLAARVEAGTLDMVFASSATAEQVQALQADPATADRVFVYPSDEEWYTTMNLAVPPFDDVAVRKAVSFAIDKDELVRELPFPPFGPQHRPSTGIVATHIAPDAMEGDLLLGWDPYPHDVGRARAEMRLSSYDHDGDGRCDDPACRGILALVDSRGSWTFATSTRRDLATIGIDLALVLEPDPYDDFFPQLADSARRVPMGIGAGWLKDYPNASTWFPELFPSTAIGSTNFSLVGASPEQLRAWGYPVTSVPSVDDRIARCQGLLGTAQTECWAELDQYLMTEVVPWVPLVSITDAQIVSDRVIGYSYDQFATEPALDRIALAPADA